MEKNIFLPRRGKEKEERRKAFGKEKYFFAEEKKNSKEIEENIWRKKIFLWRTREREKENEEIFGEENCLVSGGEEKEENIRPGEEEKSGDGKGGRYFGVLE